MTPRFACFVACALLIAQRSDAGVATVFADNFLAGSKQVVTYPAGNPSSPTLVGPQADTFSGMDFDPNARLLWAIDFTAQSIGIVNQSDGSYLPTAMLENPTLCCSAFTIDPRDGRFYGARDANIYAIAKMTGQVSQVGSISGTQITALAIDCSGRKLALAVDAMGNSALYEWAPGSTLVGASSYSGPTSLEFDNQTGTLYAWFNATAQTSSNHVTINPATGVESPLSSIEGRYRMAVRNTCPEHIFSDDHEA